MDEEREKTRAGEKTVKLINAVIDRFIRDEEDESDGESAKGGLRVFLGEVVDRFRYHTSRRRKDKEALAEGNACGTELPSLPAAEGNDAE